MYHGEKIGQGNFESYGHYTQVCAFFNFQKTKPQTNWKWLAPSGIDRADESRWSGPQQLTLGSQWPRPETEPILSSGVTRALATIPESALTRDIDVVVHVVRVSFWAYSKTISFISTYPIRSCGALCDGDWDVPLRSLTWPFQLRLQLVPRAISTKSNCYLFVYMSNCNARPIFFRTPFPQKSSIVHHRSI